MNQASWGALFLWGQQAWHCCRFSVEKGLDATGQRFKWPQGLGGSNCYPAWAEKGVQHPNPRPGLKLPLCQTPCVTLIPPLPDPCNGDETHVLRGGGGIPSPPPAHSLHSFSAPRRCSTTSTATCGDRNISASCGSPTARTSASSIRIIPTRYSPAPCSPEPAFQPAPGWGEEGHAHWQQRDTRSGTV